MTTTTPKRRTLAFVAPEARPRKLNALLFGPPKAGKTTGAFSAPGPFLFLNAETADAADFARALYPKKEIREFPLTGFQSLIDASLYLRDGGDGEKTIVVDSIGELWRILVEEVAGDRERASLQQYGDVGTRIERFCRFLTRDCPQNVVLICHEQYMDSPDGRMLMPMTGGQKNPMILCAMASVVGYVGVVTAKDKPPRYVAQVQAGSGRYAGHRGGVLDAVVDLDITDWLARYERAARPKESK